MYVTTRTLSKLNYSSVGLNVQGVKFKFIKSIISKQGLIKIGEIISIVPSLLVDSGTVHL